MATKSENSTDNSSSVKFDDKFWGQPHTEGERFPIREFETDFLTLYTQEPFLGGVSILMTKTPNPEISTACVWIHPETFDMHMEYNPYFFRSMTSQQRIGILTHEIYHLVLNHVIQRRVSNPEDHSLWNVATDMAINSMIVTSHAALKPEQILPDFVMLPGKDLPNVKFDELRKFIKNSPPLEASEYYFEGMKKILDEQKEKDKAEGKGAPSEGGGYLVGLDSMDDHGQWGELPSGVQDQIRDKMEDTIRNAVNRANSSNKWGSVSAKMQALIEEMLRSTVNWRAILRSFFGRCRSVERTSTIKKVSRKLPFILPGVKRKQIAKFAFFIDQSGSMSDADVAGAFAEVEGASKESEIDVYNFDTEIDEDSHKVWKRGRKFAWGRTRCGGTDFNAVAKFVNNPKNLGKWSGICILTDGYAPNLGMVKGARVLWVITPDGTDNATRPGDLIFRMQPAAK